MREGTARFGSKAAVPAMCNQQGGRRPCRIHDACGAQVAIPPSHHGHDLEHWPLRDTLTLGALADAVPLARAHLRQLLSGWGRAELSPDASVVVSELVTNAVAASGERRLAAAPVLVWLGSDSCCLLLAVADVSPRPPVRLDLEARRRRGPRAGAGGSAQQPVGMAPGQHHRAEESCLGGMAPASRGWSAASYRRAR